MKILLCAPNKGFIGGIFKWTNNVINYYNDIQTHSYIELKIFSTSRTKAITPETDILHRIFFGIKEYFPILKNYYHQLKKNDFHLVHITTSGSIGLLRDLIMLKIASSLNTKTVIHFHFGRIPKIIEHKTWEYKLLNKVIKKANRAIVMDKTSYTALINEGFKNVVLLPNPLTTEAKNIIDSHLEIKKKNNKIVFAGHVLQTKGVFELIEACENISDIEVKIIGHITDTMKTKITKLTGSSNKFIITGELPYSQTIKEMLSASFFVLPSYSEGFPNVILESMACGCAIVATSVGAIPEILDVNGNSKSGICVEPKNVQQLNKAIKTMINDSQFAELCSQNAKRRVQELYTTSAVCKSMEAIWKKTIY